MTRPQLIDHAGRRWLEADDYCYNLYEYNAQSGGYSGGAKNQEIHNLKKPPHAPEGQLYWKRKAIADWGDELAGSLEGGQLENITLIPAPCSKPIGHPDYDDRLIQVLQRARQRLPNLDFRALVVTTVARENQRDHGHKTVDELIATMALDPAQLGVPLRPYAIVFDDVITAGGTFKAMQRIILPTGRKASGLFLAKSVNPLPQNPFFINT